MISSAQRGSRPALRPLIRAATAVALVSAFGLVGTAPPAAATASRAHFQVRKAPSLRSQEWYLRVLGMSKVWARTKGAGVTVAVLDTGVQATVGDLRGAVVAGFDATGTGVNPNRADAEGSGTTAAVLIAGRGTNPGIIGIAPEAKIMPVYFPFVGDVRRMPTQLAGALRRIRTQPAAPQVVFMGLDNSVGPCPASVQAQVTASVRAGMILVAPSGDTGDATNLPTYPSDCQGVVVVGSYDNTGTPSDSTQRQPYVALGGPGVALPAYDTSGHVRLINGTPLAAAIVAGSFAIMRAAFAQMSSRQLVARMLATASRKYFTGPKYGQRGNQLGFGLALVHQALIQKVSADAPNPIYDAIAAPVRSPSSSAPSSSTTSSSQPPPPSGPSGGKTTQLASIPSVAGDASGSGSSNVGILVGGGAAALVIALLVVAVVRRRNGARAQ